MQIGAHKTNDYATNAISHGKFKVANNAVMQQILSKMLYSDPVRAVIRELYTNAVESMVAAKNDGKIDLKLPTWSDTQFSIRDYGTGLSKDDLEQLYCVYGLSTKRSSNEWTGGFGIGSKSVWAVANMFYVTSYHNGRKYTVINSKNSRDEFVYDLLAETDTDEPNGLEITFEVSQNNVHEYKTKAAEVLKWFDRLPKTNVSLDIKKPKYIEQGDGWNLVSYNQSYWQHATSYVVCGQVAYPINRDHFRDKARTVLDKCEVVLDINIGEVDVAPSREQLQYNQHTVEVITKILERFYDYTKDKAEKAVANCKSKWEARLLAQKFFKNNEYTKSILGGKVNYKGETIGTGSITLSKDIKLQVYNWSTHFNKVESSKTRVKIIPDENVKIALYEQGGYAAARRYIEANHDITLYVVQPEHKQILIDEVGLLESDLLYTSSFPAAVRQSRAKSVGNKIQAYKFAAMPSLNYSARSYWKNSEIDIDNESGYYCPIKEFHVEDKFHPANLQEYLKNHNVIGILMSRQDKVKNHPNWKHVSTILEEKLDKLVSDPVLNKYGNVTEPDYNTIHLSSVKDKIINKNSRLYKVLNDTHEYLKSKTKISEFNTLYGLYKGLGGKTYKLGSQKVDFSFDYSVFPLLKYISTYRITEQAVLDYINLLNK